METETEVYGAGPLSTVQKIKLLVEWAPLLALMEKVATADTNQAKVLAGVAVLRWLAAKSQTSADDSAINSLESFLKTPEGAKVIDLIWTLAGALKK